MPVSQWVDADIPATSCDGARLCAVKGDTNLIVLLPGCGFSRGTCVLETPTLLIFTPLEKFSGYWRGNRREEDGWANKLCTFKI